MGLNIPTPDPFGCGLLAPFRFTSTQDFANANTVAVNDGTHAGLYMRANTTNSGNYDNVLTAPQMYATFWSLSSSLTNQNWTEVRVWWRFSTPHRPNAFAERAELAYVDWYPASWSTANTSRFAEVFFYSSSLGAGSLGFTYLGTTSTYRGGVGSLSTSAFDSYDTAMLWVRPNSVDGYYASSGGSWPPAVSACVFSGRGGRTGAAMLTQDRSTVWFSAAPLNTAGNADILIKQLLIEYR